MSDSIKVAIRVRPLIKREKDENLPIQWLTQGNAIVAVDPEMRKRGDGGFQFDHIFDVKTSNYDVFDSIVKPIVDAAVNGFNGTVFAYGQTGSGKTFSMLGTSEEPGIIPLAIEYMFDAIADTPGREFLLRVSYLEIHNEKVNDLLSREVDLKVHEDINGQVFVKCKEEVTNCPENVWSIMNKGNKNRKIGETNMNERSSRSHTIFRITIESREADADSDGAIQVSQLNMVDLAGSERTRQTGATGQRFKEGCHINSSLSTLALVIKQLSESQDSQKYINFRDSKLTRLLQASLGGNAMTTIICAITPAALDETQCTLSFAARARSVKNKPQLNEVMSDGVLLKRYAKQIDKLQAELEKMKQQNRSAKVQEMESKIQEKDRINEFLEERIRLLQTRIVPGDNRSSAESFKCKAKRRRTWCGTGGYKPNTSTFQSCRDLSPIREMSPLKSRNRRSIIKSSDIIDSSLQNIAYADFELELINRELDREEETDGEDTFIVYQKSSRVTFKDDVIVHKTPISYNNSNVTPEKIDISTQTVRQSPDTPKETLRKRIHYLTEEYSQLEEYTTLEKQLYFEDHHSELEKLAKFSTLEKQLENLTSDKDDFEHIVSELRKKLTAAELRCAAAEDKLNAQVIELQRIPDLEKKLAQMSTQEIEMRNISKLKKQITFLTAEKDSYEYVAAELRKKLNEAEQRNILLEDKLATQNVEAEEPLIRFSLGNENVEQIELKAQVATLASEKDELQREISDLQNKLTEAELCNSSMKDKLNEQQLEHVQNHQNFEEQVNNLTSERNVFERTVYEMQNKLKEIEEVNNSMRDKLCEQKLKLEKLQDREKQIERFAFEKCELELVIAELREKLTEVTSTSAKSEINEHQRNVHEFLQVEGLIQDVETEKMESKQVNGELRDNVRETELSDNPLKIKLNEQQLCVQKIYDLEKQLEDFTTEKSEFERIIAELKEKLKDTELRNSSLQDKLNEYGTDVRKIADLQITVETLESKNSKFKRSIFELQEKLQEAESYRNSINEESSAQEYEKISMELHEQLVKSPSAKESANDRDNGEEINHLKSRINDLQHIIQDIQRENMRLKEQTSARSTMLDHEQDLSNDNSSKITEDLSITRISLEEDSAKLSADLIVKTQELDEIKNDVQSLKKDIEDLQKTIYLLTTENTELANKLSAEKECAEKSSTHYQKTIDELYARNSKITNEKLELENDMTVLNEQIEVLHSKIPDVNLNEEQIMLKYEEQINVLTMKNTELLCSIADRMKELETLKESKSLLYEHDCIYKDKLADLMEKHEQLTAENNEFSTDLMDKIEENEGLRQEYDILKSKLELSLKNREDVDNNDVEQVRTENTLLKTELVELRSNIKTLTEENSKLSNQLMETIEETVDLDNARNTYSSNNTLHLSTLFNNTLTTNDTMNKSVIDGDPEARILNLQEEVNHLTHLNRKLSDLKLSTCTQCTHLKELNENRRMLKLEVKSLSHRLADLQRKFDKKSAKTDALIMKAKEDINSSLCNSSFNVSFSENMNVTYVEERLQTLNNELQTLMENHDELSDLCKEKCENEIEELESSNVANSTLPGDGSFSVKKSSSKTASRLDNIVKIMDNLQNEFQEIKGNNLSVKMDLEKFTNEKESLLGEINSLKTANEKLMQKLSENELSLTTALEKADILENEVTDMTRKLQEFTVKYKEIENAKLLLEIEVESLKEDKMMKERTVGELRQSLSCLQHELDLIKKQKEELDDSNNFLEQEYEKKLESLRAMNEELTNSKQTILQEYADRSKESEIRLLELNEKVSKCTSENDYLKQELIKLQEIKNTFEKMRNEYQFNYQQDKTLAEDNKKLKDALNTASKNIIKEIMSLKPKADAQGFLDKSVDELFQIFLQTILAKEKEIARTMQRHFDKEKQKLEDEKQQSVDAEKRTTLWAKELESEIEKLQGDLSEREKISDGLQREVARLQGLLEENNCDRDALREKVSLLETDLGNLQAELDKHSKLDTVNEEAIVVAQKREKQAQEAIRCKQAEFQMKLKSEKEAYNRRIEDLACTIESFKTRNMELTSNIEGLEANQKQLKNIIDLKTNELARSSQIIQKMQTESEQFTDAYNDLNHELEEKTLRVGQVTELLKTKCDELTEYKTNLETIVPENKFLKQQIGERKASIEQYKMEIKALSMENERAINAIRDELNLEELKSVELNKQIAALNDKNVALTEEMNVLKADYETLRSKCITLEKRVRNSTSKIQAEEQMEELKDLNRSLRNNLDGASNRITELQAAKTDLMKQIVTLNSQYEMACKENAELKLTLSSYKSRYDDDAYAIASDEKYDALLREKNQIALELEATKVELNQRSKDIENCASKIKELTEQNAELDKEAEELADVIRQHGAENTTLQDKYYSCRAEIRTLKEEIEALEKRNQSFAPRSTLEKRSIPADRVEKSHDGECSCLTLKNKIRELQLEVVSKNGKIATLELQIRSGSFPYQAKCKELQEHLSAYNDKNSKLKAEVKRLQLAMLRTSAKECDVCKQRLVNRRDQSCQTIPNNTVRFCGISSGIIEEDLKKAKLEKEKKIMKDVCRSRAKIIKELEKRIEEYEMKLNSENS